MKPLFIFSLPRSGSTLLQRVMADQPAIATHAEPWLLLPFLFARTERGARTIYNHGVAARAIAEFVANGRDGNAAYKEALRRFALTMYEQHCKPGDAYFLDKTPRYALIAHEILDLFPDAKAIFLWRNPLSIYSSISETWCRGRWRMDPYDDDLHRGLISLIRAYEIHAERSIAIRYEDLVDNPQPVLRTLSDYLETDVELPDNVGSVSFQGTLGDPAPSRNRPDLSRKQTFEAALSSPMRRHAVRSYLNWLGSDRLKTMGYDLEVLLQQTAVSAYGTFIPDVYDFARNSVRVGLRRWFFYKETRRYRDKDSAERGNSTVPTV